MNVALVATDFDETLVHLGGELSGRNRDAVTRIRALGVKFALVSGRSPHGLLYNARKNGIEIDGLYLIGLNGALAVQAWDEKVLFSHRLDIDLARAAITLASGHDVAVIVPEGDKTMTNQPDHFATQLDAETNQTRIVDLPTPLDFAPGKVLFGGEPEQLQVLADELRSEFRDRAEVLFSAPMLLEFNAAGVTKGEALQGLCENLGIDIADTLAFGDNYNDVPMLVAAGLGVAVANAVPGALEIADLVTVACEEDAVAVVLDEIFPPT